jgi:Zn finger protein HypA/HybF involved in hydrogenase expression
MSKRKWNKQNLIEAVKQSEHITEVMQKLKLVHSSYNSQTIIKYIEEYKLDTSHWKGQIIKKNKTGHEYSPNDVFVANSTFTKSHLKEKILKYNLKSHECNECGLGPEWNGKSLSLQVDHINGINTDHRLENLRFLCPNCHTQTLNYAGSNAKNRKHAEIFTCNKCGKYRSRVSQSGLCIKCKSTNDKVMWPKDNILCQMIKETNINQTAKKLNVSFTSLKKRLIKRKLI